MTWLVPLALGSIAIALMAVFTTYAARRGRHPAKPMVPVGGPNVLVHDINDDRCTGCDACVSVCPTNVLDLVNNKSRVLRFQDCIQCEACMWACPTEALVMFPEGGEPPKLKVPELDENFQTMVKGQYLIGEVAGKPLVKNAANLGRVVVEHMLATGLESGKLAGKRAEGSDAKNVTNVDVAIVGSGPGGLSAALTCLQKGLSYVVLEKEQLIASTVSRYPKGKLFMAEPYDSENLSLLPVMDSSKEQIVEVWKDVVARLGIKINLGEAVETVKRGDDGVFDVRTTVAAYRAQRVVLGTGTRGKPRTLQVPGENLPKVMNLLDDPDEFRGKSVLIIGGGDSAVEAAMSLADAGAKVIVSYRGKSFNRCQAKNKQAIEGYEAQNRLKTKFGSQVVSFDDANVILQLADGSQKQYPNDAAFVLIGADPPVAWLEKLGVKFVERPHQYSLGKTDELVRRFVPGAVACPDDAATAAAILNGELPEGGGVRPATVAPMAAAGADDEPLTGARKWLRQATQIFAVGKKIEQPMPLSEFAKRGGVRPATHTGHGKRDKLSPGERTRVLRMLRDVGGRLADEDSRIDLPAPVRGLTAALEASPPPEPRIERNGEPMPAPRLEDVPAKQAVIVGLAKAMARGPSTGRIKRMSDAPTNEQARSAAAPSGRVRASEGAAPARRDDARREAPRSARPAEPSRQSRSADAAGTPPARRRPAPPVAPPAATGGKGKGGRRPAPFNEEPTRRVDGDSPIVNDLRNALAARGEPRPEARPDPRSAPVHDATIRQDMRASHGFDDEATRAMPEMMAVPARQMAPTAPPPPRAPARLDDDIDVSFLDAARADVAGRSPTRQAPVQAQASTRGAPQRPVEWREEARTDERRPARAEGSRRGGRDDFQDHQATKMGGVDDLAALERIRHQVERDDPTGRSNIRSPSLSDVDWDLD